MGRALLIRRMHGAGHDHLLEAPGMVVAQEVM